MYIYFFSLMEILMREEEIFHLFFFFFFFFLVIFFTFYRIARVYMFVDISVILISVFNFNIFNLNMMDFVDCINFFLRGREREREILIIVSLKTKRSRWIIRLKLSLRVSRSIRQLFICLYVILFIYYRI